MSADVKVQRGSVTIATSATTATITAGVDYDAPASATKAFIRITSSNYQGAESATLSATPPSTSAYISDPTNLLTSITFQRANGHASTGIVIDWEIKEYVGAAGGPNEFIVRRAELVTYTSNLNTGNGTALAGVVTNADVFCWLTSQAGAAGSALGDDFLTTLAFDTGNQWVTLTRDRQSNNAATVSYAAVEYTGSNWTAQRISHAFSAAGATETEAITDVGALARAVVHSQFVPGSAANNNYEMSAQVWLASTTAVSFKIDAAATVAGKVAVAWVLSNSQTGTGEVVVNRYTGTFTTDGTTSIPITAVADLTQSSIVEISQTNGQASGSPGRDQCSYRLTDTTHVLATHVGLVDTTTYRFAVLEGPGNAVSGPTAAFTTSVDRKTVTITRTSTQGTNPITSFTVDWGDGTTDSLTSHTYLVGDTYTITLTESDGTLTDDVSHDITTKTAWRYRLRTYPGGRLSTAVDKERPDA